MGTAAKLASVILVLSDKWVWEFGGTGPHLLACFARFWGQTRHSTGVTLLIRRFELSNQIVINFDELTRKINVQYGNSCVKMTKL